MSHVKDDFRNDSLNGRQIRNTIRTSLALAQLSDQDVGPEHVDAVMKTVREYTTYLQELNGMDADMSAFATGRRLPQRQESGVTSA